MKYAPAWKENRAFLLETIEMYEISLEEYKTAGLNPVPISERLELLYTLRNKLFELEEIHE
jgi:hypothetical protein